MKLNKKNVLFMSGIAVSIICSWLFIRKLEWDSLKTAFSEANYIYLLPTIIITFVSHYLRAIRWSVLISPIKKVRILSLFSVTMIGFMANNVLPARVGEIIRPMLIGKKENIKMAASLATIVIERILDSLSLIIIACVILFTISSTISHNNDTTIPADATTIEAGDIEKNPETNSPTHKENGTNLSVIKQLKKWSTILASFGILAIMALFLLSIYPHKVSNIIEKLIFFLPHQIKDKLTGLLHSFVTGLQILDNKKQLLWAGFLSIIIWLLNAIAVYVMSYSFNIELTLLGACFVIVCLALAIALPQAPGFIGVFHIATLKALDIFGVELSSAQSFAITLWAVSIIPTTIAGFIFLWKEGLHLGDITKRDEMEIQ